MKKYLIDWWNGGDGLDPTYSAYYNALTDKPSATIKTAQNNFTATLRTNGLLARMKIGHFFHAGSAGTAKFNLVNPSTYKLTAPAGDPTFSEGNGCKSSGTTYFSTPFTTTEYAGIQANITFAFYVSESSTTSSSLLRTHGAVAKVAGDTINFFPILGGNCLWNTYTTVNGSVANANHKHLYVQTVDASNHYVYIDGVKATSTADPAVPDATRSFFILGENVSGALTAPYTLYEACFFIFDKFLDADELAFRNAWTTYKTAAGLP